MWKKLDFFKVPETNIESIRSKLALKIFDDYGHILKGIYSMRFNGKSVDGRVSTKTPTDPDGPYPPSSPPSQSKFRKKKEGGLNEGTD